MISEMKDEAGNMYKQNLNVPKCDEEEEGPSN